MSEILIKNAKVVSPADNLCGVCDIKIIDGVIAETGENLTSNGEVINAEGLCAVPGLVDMHVHLRDPGQTAKEDIITGCRVPRGGGRRSYKPARDAEHQPHNRFPRNGKVYY